jgi:hypothetical protein
MTKQAISVTLHRDNLIWLKGRVDAIQCKSISELLDRLVTAARTGNPAAPARSVVGTLEIDPNDPLLEGADAALRDLFESSINRELSRRRAMRPSGKQIKKLPRG